jgi:hypothetical protein
VADWFTERAFHFYLAGLRVPHRKTARSGARSLAAACADLDAACARLQQSDGIGSVIVAAHGRGALAAALWSDRQTADSRADALVLFEPELPVRPALKLCISCPVLVVTGIVQADGGRGLRAAASYWPLRAPRRASAAAQLGSHVTWLHLPRSAGQPGKAWPGEAQPGKAWPGEAGPGETEPGQADGAGRRLFFDELGRWLGAYMYGQLRDQLL